MNRGHFSTPSTGGSKFNRWFKIQRWELTLWPLKIDPRVISQQGQNLMLHRLAAEIMYGGVPKVFLHQWSWNVVILPPLSMNRLTQTDPATFSVLLWWAFLKGSIFYYVFYVHLVRRNSQQKYKLMIFLFPIALEIILNVFFIMCSAWKGVCTCNIYLCLSRHLEWEN